MGRSWSIHDFSISNLSDDDYHTVSDAAMDRMVEYFEDIGDEHEIPGYDVEYQVSSCKKVCPPILTCTCLFLNQTNENLIDVYTHRVES